MGRLSAADEKQIRSSGSNDRDGSQDRHRLLHHGEEPGRIRSRDLGQKGQPTSKTDGEETPPAGAADGVQTGAHRRKTSSITCSIQGAGMGVPRESWFGSSEPVYPSLDSAPTMRSYPQPEFSLAICRIRVSSFGSIRGLPG